MKKLWSVIGAVSILSLVYGNAFAGSLDIPVKGYGLSFGNSQNFTGVRFNVLDKEVGRINGINVSCVPLSAREVNGLNVGLFVQHAEQLNGIGVGPIWSLNDEVNGMALTFGNVEVSRQLNGLGLGLGVIAGDIRGIAIGALGVKAKNATGLIVGGMMGTKVEDELTGLAIGFGNHNSWDTYKTRKTNGVIVYGVAQSRELNGLSIGGLISTEETNGVQIGLINSTEKLNGIQFGLLNHAANNPPGLRWLPLVNFHFGS